MEETYGRVKTDGLYGALNVVNQQGVDEREQCIHPVERRPATPRFEAKRLLLLRNEMIENVEVVSGRYAFDTAENLEIRDPLAFIQVLGKPARSEAKRVGTRFDTSERANGNGGHVFGVDLPASEKNALLEYLKTL